MSNKLDDEIQNTLEPVRLNGGLAGNRRPKFQIQRHRKEITTLYLQGIPISEIAERVGVSVSVVRTDLVAIFKTWQKEQVFDITQIKLLQLEKINLMEAELWESWFLSKKQGKVTTIKRQSGNANSQTPRNQSQEIATEKGAGDMSYMSGIQWCITERNKILGVYAPKKIAQTDTSGNDLPAARDEVMALLDQMALKAKENQQLNPGNPEVIDTVLVNEGDPDYDVSKVVDGENQSYYRPQLQTAVTIIEDDVKPREDVSPREAKLSLEIARSIQGLLPDKPRK